MTPRPCPKCKRPESVGFCPTCHGPYIQRRKARREIRMAPTIDNNEDRRAYVQALAENESAKQTLLNGVSNADDDTLEELYNEYAAAGERLASFYNSKTSDAPPA